MHIQGKTAIVTGAASGLGRAFCVALLSKGAQVSMLDFDVKLQKKTESELVARFGAKSVAAFKCDVTNNTELADVFKKTRERFGRVDIVCNNAGISDERTNWQKMVDVNLSAVINGTFLAIEEFRHHGDGGVVVNTASMGGLIAMPFAPVYCATKHGVVGFSRSFGIHAATENIRVNALCPSFADTPLVQREMAGNEGFKEVVQLEMQGGDLLSPELVAEALIQLIEDDANAGTVMRVTKAKGIDKQLYGRFARSKVDSKL